MDLLKPSKIYQVTTSKTDNDHHDEELIHLADEFAKLEGRRPRILVALTKNTPGKQFNEISSSLADLGFDVDIAPRFISFESLSRQAIENDVHVLLILVDKSEVNESCNAINKELNKYLPVDILSIIKSSSSLGSDKQVIKLDQLLIFGSRTSTKNLAKYILHTFVEKH